jgi:hypothetical protein
MGRGDRDPAHCGQLHDRCRILPPCDRTLVLTDLIETFEPHKLSVFVRWLTRLGRVQHPDDRCGATCA